MYPLIFATGAAALSAAAYFGLKSKCHCCGSAFTLNEPCLVCGKAVCGGCGCAVQKLEHLGWPVTPAGRTCERHVQQHEATVAKWLNAIEAEGSVQSFSKHYRGRTPKPRWRVPIESQFHADRGMAERELRILAAMERASHVVGVDLIREQRASGNYIHNVWKATGVI